MADVISRLKLESGEFDFKIKRAAQGIQRMAEECHNAGGILNQLEDENRAYIQSLGSMATVATTAKGKLAELTAAFTDIRSQYNALSDEEKQGEFGQELNKQLEIMKGRINDAKTELNDISRELGDTGNAAKSAGGFLQQLSDKFVVNIDAMKLFDLGLKAVKGALNVVKDAFFASEANVDMWGRTTMEAESIYNGFLNSLNTGDISGYLSRIDQISEAAKKAYDELDRLSTQKAINNAASQGQRVENERMRTMLRTGRYIAPADGRAPTPGLKEGDKLSQKQLAAIAKQLDNGQQSLNKFIRDDIKQAGKSIDALYNKQAKELGLTLKEFRAGTANMGAFDERIQGYKDYAKWEREHTTYTIDAATGGTNKIVSGVNPYRKYAAWGVFKDDGETFTAINNLINERAGYQSQLYSNAASNYRAINRGTGGGGGGRGGGSRGGGRGGQQQEEYIAQTQKLDFSSVAGYMLNPLDIEGSLEAGRRAAEEMERFKDIWQQVQDRTYTITINDTDALEKLHELKGVDIGAKSFEITTEDTDALEKVKEIQGATIKPKEFAITSNGAEAIAKLKDIDGIKIDKKDFTLTANYEEAIEKVKAVDGVTIKPKTFVITADDADALAQLKTIDGIKIQPKTVTFTTEDGEALKDISGVSILSEGKLPGLQGDISMLDMSSPIEAMQAQLVKADNAYQAQGMDAEQRQKEAQKQAFKEALGNFSENFGQLTSGMNQLVGGVQQLGIKVPAGINKMLSAMQAITSILTAIQTINNIKGLFAHSGGVVKAATGYTVPGNYGFDAVPAMLTSGETVLTRAQAGNLASQLSDNARSMGTPTARLSGEDIYIAVSNYMTRRGYGELAVAR